MFEDATVRAVAAIAARLNVETAALLAVAEVESGGKAFALVGGRREPLIRWEGHYFDRRLSGKDRAAARAQRLASPLAGAIGNPASQAARWALLDRAILINAEAAYESCSYGVGQVMGAHWRWLGFGAVTDLVNLCRRDVAGQVDVMARFADKAGLAGALRAHDWTTFARGYNGPGFAKYKYDKQMAAAYGRLAGKIVLPAEPDHTVKAMQLRLIAHGFAIEADGVRGSKTDAALKAFQRAKKFVVDGVAGSATWAALDADPS